MECAPFDIGLFCLFRPFYSRFWTNYSTVLLSHLDSYEQFSVGFKSYNQLSYPHDLQRYILKIS
jgi:hypothetical protein